MSKIATKWAWDMADTMESLSSSAVLVLAALAYFHNQETGRCNPSVSRIAKRTHQSERTVQRAIAELVAAKLLSVHRTQVWQSGRKINLPNRYVFRTEGGVTVSPGVPQLCHPKESYKSARARPAAFYDLANLLDPED